MAIWHANGAETQRILSQRWPDLPWARVRAVDMGWDFRVWILDDRWVVRAARTHAASWRLSREWQLLDRYLSDVPFRVPRYERRTEGAGVYPMIPGLPLSDNSEPSEKVLHGIREFLERLSCTTPSHRPEVLRGHWIRRFQAWSQKALREVDPLLSIKEGRRIRVRLDEAYDKLCADDWNPVLLHGDLVPEHVLEDRDGNLGFLDFGDWRWGDPAFDWSGIAGLDRAMPDYGREMWPSRIAGYRLTAGLNRVSWALRTGDVEGSEMAMRVLRRRI